MIFQTSMIMFHVNLPGCRDPGSPNLRMVLLEQRCGCDEGHPISSSAENMTIVACRMRTGDDPPSIYLLNTLAVSRICWCKTAKTWHPQNPWKKTHTKVFQCQWCPEVRSVFRGPWTALAKVFPSVVAWWVVFLGFFWMNFWYLILTRIVGCIWFIWGLPKNGGTPKTPPSADHF